MATKLEDYALIGDLETAALVSRDGSIDWLCLPRFDSGACFAALLGSEANGRWRLAPVTGVKQVSRRYEPGTLVLQTDWRCETGSLRVLDFMPLRSRYPTLIRIVEGLEGEVAMRLELTIRFDYGSTVPWVTRRGDGLNAIAGPNMLRLVTPVALVGQDFRTLSSFTIKEDERCPFVLTWYPSTHGEPRQVNAQKALSETRSAWHQWTDAANLTAFTAPSFVPWRDAVERSLITLKALTYKPTGGIVAAATASLPEQLGGSRNWDYRYCWLRDATFTLLAFKSAGYKDEAKRWYQWLLRVIAGMPLYLLKGHGLGGR